MKVALQALTVVLPSCWVNTPAGVTGAMAPARVNGVITDTWPALAKSMMPWHMGMSSWRGELVLITV